MRVLHERYSITGSTPLVDSIFSVKYALYSDAVSNTELMMYLRESGGTYLYENLYTLPLGFVLPSDIEETGSMRWIIPRKYRMICVWSQGRRSSCRYRRNSE